MREIRTSGSEGGGAGNSTGPPYPYRAGAHKGRFPHAPGDMCVIEGLCQSTGIALALTQMFPLLQQAAIGVQSGFRAFFFCRKDRETFQRAPGHLHGGRQWAASFLERCCDGRQPRADR